MLITARQGNVYYMILMYVGGIKQDTGDQPGGNNFLSDLIHGRDTRGVSRIFEKGGPISLGSLKIRSSDFKRGGPMV